NAVESSGRSTNSMNDMPEIVSDFCGKMKVSCKLNMNQRASMVVQESDVINGLLEEGG
ncbi:hypothetical protein HAX54_011011, partial [Datura stramonium]|nr:hypothetical protein [Datura stramonium]